uniref:HtrA serine peptidase 4 n=1 Tax=Maylandia zebra TaxID=106582 RepID=A0A3P9B2S0_9CICH
MKSLADLTLVFSAVHTGLLRERQTCLQVCVKDACGCCVVCAAGEGEACGKRSSGHLSCGNGLRCDSGPGKAGGLHSLCMCASSGPVCGSDGRTYPSICRLRAENRRAELGETSPVFLIQRGRCDSGKLAQHPGSIRYKFNFIADVVDKIVPAVVHLELFQRVPFSSEEVSVSSGSGFIVSEDGWIVTNAHVLTNKQRIKVEDVDQKMDIALIKIDPDVSVLLFLWGSQGLRQNQWCVSSYLKEREPEFPDVSSGVYIYEVIPGTAASRGGMTDHDVIIGINGHPVHTTQEVSDAVKHSTSVFVLVRRKDGDVTLMIIPEETD